MNILFVEDEDVARVGLTILLEDKGHKVDFAKTVDEAVKLLKKKVVDFH